MSFIFSVPPQQQLGDDRLSARIKCISLLQLMTRHDSFSMTKWGLSGVGIPAVDSALQSLPLATRRLLCIFFLGRNLWSTSMRLAYSLSTLLPRTDHRLKVPSLAVTTRILIALLTSLYLLVRLNIGFLITRWLKLRTNTVSWLLCQISTLI